MLLWLKMVADRYEELTYVWRKPECKIGEKVVYRKIQKQSGKNGCPIAQSAKTIIAHYTL